MKRILPISTIAAALFATVAFTPVSGAIAQTAAPAQSAAPSAQDQDATKQLAELKANLKTQVGAIVAALSTPDAQKLKAQVTADVTALTQLKQDYAKAKAANGDVSAIEKQYSDTVSDIVKSVGSLRALADEPGAKLQNTVMQIQLVAMFSGQTVDKAEIDAILKPLQSVGTEAAAGINAIKPVVKATQAAVTARHENGERITQAVVDEELAKAAAADLAAQ